MTKIDTPQQQAVQTFMQTQRRHLAVRARAGTGKTYLLEKVARNFSPKERAVALAFNTANAKELSTRLPPNVRCCTFHSLGFSALKRMWGQKMQPNRDRQRQLVERIVPFNTPNRLSAMSHVLRATSLSMNALAQTDEEVAALMMDHDIPFEQGIEPRSFINWVLDTMVASLQKTNTPSFDDMIYVPAALSWPTGSFQKLLVDEVQDTNNAQMALVRNAAADSGQFNIYGDDRQALYRFRGAGDGQFDQIKFDLQAEELPLNWTFRCPRRVVELAQTIVGDYTATPEAPEGAVYWRSESAMLREAQPGDAVISRTNYGCMRVCLAFLRRGRRARIVGKSFIEELTRLLDRSRARTIPALLTWLDTYLPVEISRLREAKRDDRADALGDSAETLREISANAANLQSVEDLRRTIDELLSETAPENTIQIMTVHKAKGLEWDRVWLIESTFNVRNTEGENCYYVGVTRTRRELFLVAIPQANGRTPGSIARDLLPQEIIRQWENDDSERTANR